MKGALCDDKWSDNAPNSISIYPFLIGVDKKTEIYLFDGELTINWAIFSKLSDTFWMNEKNTI